MELVEYLSLLCIVVTVASFSAGMLANISVGLYAFVMSSPPCRQILQNRSTRDIPFMPFINGAIINISILWYGYLKEDFTVIVVNTIGSIIHVAYVLIYNVYSHQKTNTLKKTLLGMAILSILYIYLQMIVVERAAIVQRLGILTLVLLMHGNLSPLFALIDVVKTKSSHGVALPFTIAMLVTSILWLLYGFVVNDVYILIPSISGMVSSMIQLVFVVIYPPNKSAEKTE